MADPADHTFKATPSIKVRCSGAPVPMGDDDTVPGECTKVVMSGKLTKRNMGHRLGAYELQVETYGGRPVYRNETARWGSAYLYFDGKYWVIGPTVGSQGVNLFVPSHALSPDRVRGEWSVADAIDHTFVKGASVKASCAHRAGGVGVGRAGGGKVLLRFDADVGGETKTTFGEAKQELLLAGVAAALQIPQAAVTVKGATEWDTSVVLEINIVLGARKAPAVLARLRGKAFKARVIQVRLLPPSLFSLLSSIPSSFFLFLSLSLSLSLFLVSYLCLPAVADFFPFTFFLSGLLVCWFVGLLVLFVSVFAARRGAVAGL